MSEYDERHARLLEKRQISLVLDVGANRGQFALRLRNEMGYRERIVSFEPLNYEFSLLQKEAAHDPLWKCHNLALGETDGEASINVSANSFSSSLCKVAERSLRLDPSLGAVSTQTVTVRRLDGLLKAIARDDDVICLKIDTQGYEKNVLEGAAGVIHRFALIRLETALYPTYEDAPLIGEMICYLDRLGYRAVGIEPGWEDYLNGEMLEADVIFARK